MSAISDLVNFAKADKTNTLKEINFSSIPNLQSKEIFDKTGVTVKGCFKKLSSFSIRHILNGHGNVEKENAIDQLAVTNEDFEYIPQILSNPDSIIKGNTNNNGRSNSVVFIKKINNHNYNLIMRLDSGNLIVMTMFIKK